MTTSAYEWYTTDASCQIYPVALVHAQQPHLDQQHRHHTMWWLFIKTNTVAYSNYVSNMSQTPVHVHYSPEREYSIRKNPEVDAAYIVHRMTPSGYRWKVNIILNKFNIYTGQLGKLHWFIEEWASNASSIPRSSDHPWAQNYSSNVLFAPPSEPVTGGTWLPGANTSNMLSITWQRT